MSSNRQREFIKKHLSKAKAKPRKFARWMRVRGYYPPSMAEDEIVKRVRVHVRDIEDSLKDPGKIADMRKCAVGVDLIMAYRYTYYVHGISMLSDKAYDDLEAEEREYGGGGKVLDHFVGSDVADHYPPHIRALGMYLAFKYKRTK